MRRSLNAVDPDSSVGLPPLLRDALAMGAIFISLSFGLNAVASASIEDGIRLHVGPDRITVADTSPWGAVARTPLRPEMVVLRINSAQVSEFPTDVEQPMLDRDRWPALLTEPLRSIEAVPANVYEDALESGEQPPLSAVITYLSPRSDGQESWPAMVAAVVLLAGMWWWLVGQPVRSVRRLAGPASAAVSVPLLMLPYAMSWGVAPILASALIVPIAFFPLADGLLELFRSAEQRRAHLLLLGVTVTACVGGLLLARTGASQISLVVAAALAAGVLAVPIAYLYRQGPDGSLSTEQSVLTPLELAAIVITALLALTILAFRTPGLLWLLVFWIVTLAAAQRFTITPLTRLVRRTRLQRDLVVEATEAERARIATDLHDVALQELSMLAMRLDAKGDAESAAAARDVAQRVREICGDLRLPLLDDFGVGPALEWLVDRLEQVAPGRIQLEQEGGARLPPDVELAMFRVAQEALGNAVQHGRPPIVVRFRAVGDHALLSIDDAGLGISADASDAAQHAGRFGLMNMQQRAEQVGALLDIHRWPTGGTHVGLEWRAS